MVAVGAPTLRIPLLTHAVLLAIPAALAVPAGIPPIWVPGAEPMLLWTVNLLAAALMLLTAWRYMVKPRVPRLSREHSGDTSERAPERGGSGRGAAQPGATASRAPGSVLSRALVWRRVCIGTILGLVLANVLRAVLWTFLTGPSLTIYAATVGLSAVLSVVVGAVLGAIIGAIAAAAAPAR